MDVPRDWIECDAPCCRNLNALVQCKDCRSVYYCSTLCQREDADAHQSHCLAMTRKLNDGFDPSAPISGREASHSNLSALSVMTKGEGAPIELCSICLEDLIKKNVPVATVEACKHVFCLTCLIQWQRHSDDLNVPNGEDLNTVHEGSAVQALNDVNAFDPIFSRFTEKFVCCPCCRTATEDLEYRLFQKANEFLARAKLYGCPQSMKKQLLLGALEATSTLLQIEDPDLRAYHAHADVLLALGRCQDAVISIQQLMKADKERYTAMKENPVLAWLDYARHACEIADTAQATVAMKTAAEIAACIGRPAKPPPALHGSDRKHLYEVAYLLRGEAHQQQNQWWEALLIYNKLLRAHHEKQTASATNQLNDLFSDDLLVQMWKGISSCSYELAAYAASIAAANRAVAIDRSVAGIHRCKALSLVQQAANSPEKTDEMFGEAVRTMNQAVLYEAPWDSHNQSTNLKLYQSLSQDYSNSVMKK